MHALISAYTHTYTHVHTHAHTARDATDRGKIPSPPKYVVFPTSPQSNILCQDGASSIHIPSN